MTQLTKMHADMPDAAAHLAQCFGTQPILQQNAAAFSLQLSAAAYHMHTTPFRQNGWMDFSFQVDHTLMTGSKVNASHGVHGKISRLFTKLARHRLHRSDPISQLYGTLRQRDKSDTCKALVMAHPLADNRYMIAIGFMGTGKRLFDWISNFRISKMDHMHRGFLQLTKEFESRADEIRFPQIARELDMPRLTLEMVLEECTREDSRFCIWMSGHSQGSAVMQVFTHHLLQNGVLAKHLYGIGFASPTVMHDGPVFSHYPLHHLICADDLTPRIGAKKHLGTCHVLPMTDDMRMTFYGNAFAMPGFASMLQQINQMSDTRTALLFALGFLRALSHLSDKEAGAVLSSLASMNMPDALVDWLGDSVSRMLMLLSGRLTRSYRQITGETNPPSRELKRYEHAVLTRMRIHTPRRYAALLSQVLSVPHHLRGSADASSAYKAMTEEAFGQLRSMDTLPGAWPVRVAPLHLPRKYPPKPRQGMFSRLRRNRQ